jgi:hypothetical protein
MATAATLCGRTPRVGLLGLLGQATSVIRSGNVNTITSFLLWLIDDDRHIRLLTGDIGNEGRETGKQECRSAVVTLCQGALRWRLRVGGFEVVLLPLLAQAQLIDS